MVLSSQGPRSGTFANDCFRHILGEFFFQQLEPNQRVKYQDEFNQVCVYIYILLIDIHVYIYIYVMYILVLYIYMYMFSIFYTYMLT